MADLLVTLPNGQTWRKPLSSGPLVVGRDPDCEVHLDDPGVSRHHVRLHPEDGGYVLEDLGSKNGTQVNGCDVRRTRLRDGDLIACGTATLLYREPAAEAGTTSVVLTQQEPVDRSTRFSTRDSRLLLPQRRLQVLYELSDRLTRLRDPQDLLEDAMSICFEMFRFERGAIGVRPGDRRGIDWPVIRNATGTEGELTISRSIVARALERGERAVIEDAEASPVDPSVSMVRHGIRSALCVPIEYRGEILGVIYGDRQSSGTLYSAEDLDFLAGLARQVSIGLVNGRLVEEQKLKTELEKEIALAREIQQKLFPASLPNNETIQVAALNEPGRQVSGDYYDIIELDDGQLGILIADVTGKGVASSLLMANLQAAVRVTLDGSRPLNELLGTWNSLIYHNTDPGKFVTCLVAIVDPRERTVALANAGHYLPYVVQADRGQSWQIKVSGGVPLGLMSPVEYVAHTIQLRPGPCTLFCFTDGVVEAVDSDDAFFGLERTFDVLNASPDLDPARMIANLRSCVTGFCGPHPQGDDITMVAVHLP